LSGLFTAEDHRNQERTMKKDQSKSHFKEMKDKVKVVAGKFVGFREPGHPRRMQNAHGNIEAAYADLKNKYKKAGEDKRVVIWAVLPICRSAF
jgi:uncharacterized protein YjbJ (UPF0337 family)